MKLTDETILSHVGERSGHPTYVIKNSLRMYGVKVETPWVRRQLQRLERSGRVQRDHKREYGQHHCWALTDAGRAAISEQATRAGR